MSILQGICLLQLTSTGSWKCHYSHLVLSGKKNPLLFETKCSKVMILIKQKVQQDVLCQNLAHRTRWITIYKVTFTQSTCQNTGNITCLAASAHPLQVSSTNLVYIITIAVGCTKSPIDEFFHAQLLPKYLFNIVFLSVSMMCQVILTLCDLTWSNPCLMQFNDVLVVFLRRTRMDIFYLGQCFVKFVLFIRRPCLEWKIFWQLRNSF